MQGWIQTRRGTQPPFFYERVMKDLDTLFFYFNPYFTYAPVKYYYTQWFEIVKKVQFF